MARKLKFGSRAWQKKYNPRYGGKKTARRRRRKTAGRKKRSYRRRGGSRKKGIATWAGFAYTGYLMFKEWKFRGTIPEYQKLGPRLMGTFFGIYQKDGKYDVSGVLTTARAQAASTNPEVTSVFERYTPAAVGWGISTFVGGRGYKGLPGLNANKYLPGRFKL